MNSLLSATAPLLAPAFVVAGSAVSWLELLALVLAVWMVLCNLRVNPLAWPLAMVSSALYGLLFLHSKLYGEAGLQLLFIALAAWGWWQWLRGTGETGRPLVVGWLPWPRRLQLLALTLAAWPLLGLLLHSVTDSDVPYLDALPTVGSIAGQLLLARKRVDNWPVWVAVNLVSVVLFTVKGLWLTAALYALFTAMAVAGWRAWARLADSGGTAGAARA
jgi:nicotinamide mononucleotide transporter